MEEGNVCIFCKRSFLNKNLLDVHMIEQMRIEKHNNIEHDQVEADKKVIKKEVKLEVDEEKVIKKEINLEVDGVKSSGPNDNPKGSDLICKQCGEEFHSSSDLSCHMSTHLDDEVKRGALSLLMISKDRKDLILDEDKVVIPNVNVDGEKNEGNGESGPGQSGTGLVNCSLRSMPTFKCMICFKEFSSYQGLEVHYMKIHEN